MQDIVRTHREAPTTPTSLSTRAALAAITALAALATVLSGCGLLGLESAEDRPVASAPERAPDTRLAAVVEGEEISYAELHAFMQEQFLEQLLGQPDEELFEIRERAIRDLVQERVVEAAAAERALSPEALFEEITAAVPPASDEDVAGWYRANESRLRGAPLDEVSDRIRMLLDNEARANAWRQFIEPRVAALDWRMAIEPPRRKLDATRLVRGDVDAPVTIMTFSDYQCPYCIRSEPVLAAVLDRYPGEVRVIHRHFPLDSIHPFARPASEAAMCADEQGRFWDFHDAIFARNGRLDEASFGEIATTLELDGAALDQCIEERRYRDFVQADFDAGQAAGVTGTPAFFVNGIPLKGARTADQLSEVVDAELARLAAR